MAARYHDHWIVHYKSTDPGRYEADSRDLVIALDCTSDTRSLFTLQDLEPMVSVLQ